MQSLDAKTICEWGRSTLRGEAQALLSSAENLGDEFALAVSLLLECSGKIVVTGMGKSGHVARKMAATFSSTGSAAVFLHPSEALHGDLGILGCQDVLIAIAHSGETREVVEVAKFAHRRGRPIIALTGKAHSSLAELARTILLTSVDREVCPLNLAPTASTTLALSLGDALAVSLMRARGFREEDFAELHPEGSLGRRLARVADFMRARKDLSWASTEDSFHDLLQKVNNPNFGVVGVLDKAGLLTGVVTDGDLRRSLLSRGATALELLASDVMGSGPKTIAKDRLIADALKQFETYKITSLFVVDPDLGGVVGLLRLHDLMESKVI